MKNRPRSGWRARLAVLADQTERLFWAIAFALFAAALLGGTGVLVFLHFQLTTTTLPTP